jgi:uncharacterized damage-inducible protein DinB
MMPIHKALKNIFSQLVEVLNQISNEQYTAPQTLLNQATIGQHYRHLIEVFTCLQEGYDAGVVNYDNRRRDKLIEQNRSAALFVLAAYNAGLQKPEKQIQLVTAYDVASPESESFHTSYNRELAYALEHAVHHMALIRIGLQQVAPQLQLPEDFGVACSTIKFRKACVQ